MTIDRHDPDATPELQDEFWGEQSEWTAPRRPAVERAGFGATVGRWWNGVLGGRTGADREHDRAHGRAVPSHDLDDGPAERHRDDDPTPTRHLETGEAGDDAWTLQPEPQPARRPGGDPLLARLGGLAVIVTLAAPLALGLAASRSDTRSDATLPANISSAPPVEEALPPTTAVAQGTAVVTTPIGASAPTSSPSVTDGAETPSTAPVAETAAEPTASAPAPVLLEAAPAPEPTASATRATAPTVTAAPTVTTPPCGASYELAAGDYWIRIADAADVPLAQLLAVNDSSVDTVLVPGRSICLPVGASTPAAPTPVTTAPSTSEASATTATTVAAAPTTTTPPRPSAVPESQSVAIIRDVWPDDLEERAIEIAWRESNHRSNVNNWCCYGLFQIHWNAHRSWLATIGVTSVSQLYDPVVNANAAYTLYQRAGGFGPWGG